MVITVRICIILAAGLLCAVPTIARAEFEVAYAAGNRDAAGRFMGGTELRVLTSHAGRLYAGLGYWEDRPGPEGPQSAAILALDVPGTAWRVDHAFADRMPDRRWRDFAISALHEARFAPDGAGTRLAQPIALLLAASWDRTGTVRVFSRDDTTGAWTPTTLAQDRPLPDFLPQVRSLATHRDARTGVDRVFAGTDPRGIYSGVYDPTAPGHIDWVPAPELDIRSPSADAFPGLGRRLRVSSFAECNGALFAAVGQFVFERIDGPAPR